MMMTFPAAAGSVNVGASQSFSSTGIASVVIEIMVAASDDVRLAFS
jgi:hypothetical protein